LNLKRILLPTAFAALLGSSGIAVAGSSASLAADAQNMPSLTALGGSSDYATVEAGSSAPDFAYESLAGTPAHLHDLRAFGHVLLVFGASNEDLARLQGECDRLTRLGVVPVAVLDWRTGACRSVVHRLGLTFPVVPDPQRAIGAMYNTLDPNTRHDAPAWFVIDRKGHVRGLDRFEWPRDSWVNLAATSLGLPAADAPQPVTYPR
jgi:peroxiredoxin